MALIRSVGFVLVVYFVRTPSGFQVLRQKATNENDGATDSELVCLGSLCGRPRPQFLGNKADEEIGFMEYDMRGRYPFCGPDMWSPSRLVLLPMVPLGHGSTALASVLMSGGEISTLCGADTWRCDGRGIADEVSTPGTNNWLQRFSRHWNLRKHVLLAPHPDIKMELSAFEDELKNGPPEIMKSVGIKRVFLLHLIMWRPICMGMLSGTRSESSLDYARSELRLMEEQVEAHKRLVLEDQPVLVISLADLLWNPSWSKSRMEKMIPCIGKLDFDATPELHYDHHPKNDFKIDTTVWRFGEANPASQCGYNLRERSCDTAHNAFLDLPQDEQMRAQEATNYLDQLSK